MRRQEIADGLWTPYRLLYSDRETAREAGAFDWGSWQLRAGEEAA